ncbi:MAG: PKD domain-containing protein [Bacteroidota bacterium]
MKQLKISVILCGLFAIGLLLPQATRGQCTLPQFGSAVTVTNPNGTALTDYVVKVRVNTSALQAAGKLGNEFGFVFLGEDCSSQLPYWPSDADAFPTANATYYVKIPSLPANDSVRISVNYDASTTCSYVISDVFDGIGNSGTQTSPVGFAAATTWEISTLTFPQDVTTYRWDIRSDNAGNIRPKTTYTLFGNQYVQADGTLASISSGLNELVDEIIADNGAHPGFFSGSTILRIGQNCGLCRSYHLAANDVPPVTAPLTSTVANDARIRVWYRPRAASEPTTNVEVEFDRSTVLALTPSGYIAACRGDSVTFSVPTGFTNYKWYFDGVLDTAGLVLTHTFGTDGLVAGPHTVRVDGFFSSCDSVTTSEILNIHPTPTIDSLRPDTICEGTPFNGLPFITTDGAVIIQYDWTWGDGNTGSGMNAAHTYATSGMLNLELAIRTDSGCVDTLVEPIVVHSKPVIASITETDICWPELVQYSNSSSIPGNWASVSIVSYDWTFGDGNTGSGSSVSHGFALPNQYPDRLIVTTDFGCSDTLTGSVDVWPKPSVNSITDPNICWPQPVSFSNNSTISNNWNSATVDIYDWRFGDNTSGMGSSTTHAYAVANRYDDSLIVVTNNGCRDTLAETVDVWPKPVIDSVTAPDICWPQAVQYEGFHQIPDNWNSASVTNHDWNFGDANTATSNPASHVFATANQYTYTYVVTTGDGCRDTTSAPVDVWPKPDITALFETDTCWPDTVLFWNSTDIPSNWNTASVAAWDWRFGDGATGGDSATQHYFAVPDQYIDTLFVTTTDACMDTLSGSVDVWPKPVIDSIVTADVCEPNAVDFMAASVIPNNWNGATFANYAWDFGDGNSGSGLNVTHLYATWGQYTVTLIVTTSDNCRDTLSTTVNVFPKPVADYGLMDICFGDSLYITDSSTVAGSDTLLYFWSFGDGTISTVKDPVHAYAFDGTYSVTLVVTSGAGCSDTLITTVEVFPKPNASFSFPRTCEPDPVAFLDASTVSSGVITTYTWSFGDGNTSSLQNPMHAYFAADTFDVGLIVTTDNACTDSLTRELVWNPKPGADFSFQNVCWPDPMQLMDASSLAWGAITDWAWDLGDGTTATTPNVTHFYTNAGAYTVNLIVVTDSSCRDTVSYQATANEKPIAAISPGSICLPDTVNFVDLSTIAAGNVTAWSWDFGDGGMDSVQNPNYFYGAPGTYSLEFSVTSDSGCTDTVLTQFDAFPYPGLDLGADTMWLCPFNTVTLNAGDQFLSYLWDNGSADSIRVVDMVGTYYVDIVDVNGCPQRDSVIVPLAPQPVLDIAPGDSVAYCTGGGIEVDAQTPGVLAYLWDGTTTSSNITIAQPGDYTVIGWNVYGCSDTLTVNAVENPLPTVDLGPDIILCGTETVDLSAGSFAAYLWSNGATDSSITVRATVNMALTATDANGCSGSDTILVERFDLPVVNLGPDSSLCAGDEMVFDAGSFVDYLWSTGTTGASITVDSAGLYFVQVTDLNGCMNTSNMVNVTVDPLPDIPIVTKERGVVALMSTTEAAWQWYLDGNPIAGANLQEYIPAQSGEYQVQVTNQFGCLAISERLPLQLEIFEEEMFEGISPNNDGKNDFLVIPSIEYYPENEIVIYSRWGNEVYRRTGYVNHFNGTSAAGDPLPDGTYYYVLDLGNGQTPIKGYFVIHR